MHEIVDEGIHSTERFLPSSLFREKVKKTIQFTLKQIDKNLLIYRDLFPAPASKNGFYGAVKNEGWTASFWTGMLWLAYELTSDKKYRDAAEIQLKSFQSRLEKNISMETHDIGFLYTLSCVAATKLTKNTEARRTAIKAANRLLGRYLQKAGIIQAWGSLSDPKTSGCMIIDCLMNLPLLYWASEESGDRKYAEAAYQHAKSTAQYIVRPDASTYHTFYMDIETGKPKYGKTRQGYSDTSCWSRGQAWSIYGFSLSYAYTKDPAFLDIAGKTANYFLNRLPKDNICCWDLIFTDDSTKRDSSAAAIAVCGLLQYLNELPLLDSRRKVYEKAAFCIVNSLIDHYLVDANESNGLLKHAVYSIPEGKGIDECCIWGDYFFFESLMRLTHSWRCYW